MKKTILFFVIIILFSCSAAAIYQAPLTVDQLPSRNIKINTVMDAKGVMRSLTTGETIVNVPRKAWSSEGTDETAEDSRKAIPYQRRQSFQSDLEFGTQAHSSSQTSQSDMNRFSIFRRKTPSVLGPTGNLVIININEQSKQKKGYSKEHPLAKKLKMKIDRSGEKKEFKSNYEKTPTGQAILPGEELNAEPLFEGKFPPLMPGETRPYNPETSGLTRDYLHAEEQVAIAQRHSQAIGAVTGMPEQSPKGANPYALGGAGKTLTAGKAIETGYQEPFALKENPYTLGGAGKMTTSGQAGEIDSIISARQKRAQEILAQINR
ncbi:hypothetical protein KY304_01160 [Candidatus Woesearchaeota archaeon]|nr:hypothetical protein [Candidatus Woesearchaeota archaeon]